MPTTSPTPPATRIAQRFYFVDDHALDRLGTRTAMTPAQLLELLHTGRSVWLTNVDKNTRRRGHILVYSATDQAWYVVVVAVDDPAAGAAIVTVLERAHFEADLGQPIDSSWLYRAMAPVVPQHEASAWRQANMAPSRREQRSANRRAAALARSSSGRVKFKVDYRDPATAVILRAEFDSSRGYEAAADMEDIKVCLNDDAFWKWLGQQLSKAGVPVDYVVAIKATPETGDTVPLLSEEGAGAQA